jgi:hypothetical protein
LRFMAIHGNFNAHKLCIDRTTLALSSNEATRLE